MFSRGFKNTCVNRLQWLLSTFWAMGWCSLCLLLLLLWALFQNFIMLRFMSKFSILWLYNQCQVSVSTAMNHMVKLFKYSKCTKPSVWSLSILTPHITEWLQVTTDYKLQLITNCNCTCYLALYVFDEELFNINMLRLDLMSQ